MAMTSVLNANYIPGALQEFCYIVFKIILSGYY